MMCHALRCMYCLYNSTASPLHSFFLSPHSHLCFPSSSPSSSSMFFFVICFCVASSIWSSHVSWCGNTRLDGTLILVLICHHSLSLHINVPISMPLYANIQRSPRGSSSIVMPAHSSSPHSTSPSHSPPTPCHDGTHDNCIAST